jgi:integrase
LPFIRFHDLRHTTGTFLHLEGASPFTIQQILGHTQLSTTRRYTLVMDSVKQDAANRLDELLNSKPIAAASLSTAVRKSLTSG